MFGGAEGASLKTVTPALRLLVVDDHPVVLEGVKLLVQRMPIDVIGYARNATEAVERAAELQPDIVLLDLRLPDMLAPEVAGELRRVVPAARIVVFTAFADHAALARLRSSNVHGCLLKDSNPSDLGDAICRVARGELVFDPRIEGLPRGRDAGTAPGCALTPREHEVLRRVAMGETNPEIAAAIGLSRNTVKAYLQSVLQKLAARNRLEAVVRANEAGLL